MGELISIGTITKLDIDVNQILEQAKDILEGVVLIGFDKTGDVYTASSYADGGDVMWLLEMCKQRLLGY